VRPLPEPEWNALYAVFEGRSAEGVPAAAEQPPGLALQDRAVITAHRVPSLLRLEHVYTTSDTTPKVSHFSGSPWRFRAEMPDGSILTPAAPEDLLPDFGIPRLLHPGRLLEEVNLLDEAIVDDSLLLLQVSPRNTVEHYHTDGTPVIRSRPANAWLTRAPELVVPGVDHYDLQVDLHHVVVTQLLAVHDGVPLRSWALLDLRTDDAPRDVTSRLPRP
jgi:hypothetical protein